MAIELDELIPLTNKLQGGGFATTAVGWLASSTGIAMVGLVLTIFGFTANIVYQRKRDAREKAVTALVTELELKDDERKQQLHDLQMQVLQKELNNATSE